MSVTTEEGLPAAAELSAAAAVPSPRRREFPVSAAIALVVLIGLLIWEAIVRLELVNDRFVAAPTQTAKAAFELAGEAEPRNAVLQAILLFLIAFVISGIVGIIAGAGMGLSRVLYRVFHPLVLALFSTPKMVFIPIFVLISGYGTTTKLSYAAVSAFFPVAVAVTAGVRTIDKRLLLAADSMGASRWQRFRVIILPGSLPSIMAALWFGMKHALLGILVMELWASQKAIGYFIDTYSAAGRTDRVFALIFTMALFAILLGSLWRWLEKRMGRWRMQS
jgi:ABC-type nitrate/sulfonate/bicarbonate transport system permease component